MLGKLLKYEINDSVKTFTPFYAIVFFLCLLTSIILKVVAGSEMLIENTLISIITGTITSVTIISLTIIITMVGFFIIARFYTNLIKTEGYFMHSLPVSPHLLIISKFITAFILIILTIIFIIFCSFIFILIFGEIPLEDFLEGLRFVVFEGILTFTFFIQVTAAILFSYASIAMGSLFTNKIIGAIVAYVAYSTARTFITAIITVLASSSYDGSFEEMWSQTLWVTNSSAVIFIIISYVITYFIFKEKLNLE